MGDEAKFSSILSEEDYPRAKNLTHSIVYGVVAPRNTESSQKPEPFHPVLADALMNHFEEEARHRSGHELARGIEDITPGG
jgi:hypothetical protein